MKKNSGITLIALVVTIIIMLILATISVTTLSGNNSLLKNAGKAKEDAEIKNEKSIISQAVYQAMNNNRFGELEKEEFKNELNLIAGQNTTMVTGSNEIIGVIFISSSRYYTVNLDGEITKVDVTEEELAEIKAGRGIYAKLYQKDGEKFLVIDNNKDFTYSDGTLVKSYEDENQEHMKANNNYSVWRDDVQDIGRVVFNGNVYPDSTVGWFADCSTLKQFENIERLNTKYVTDMTAMFSNCSQITEIDVTKFNTENVTSMSSMFNGCKNLKEIDVTNFDGKNLTNMTAMFLGCESLTTLNLGWKLSNNKCTKQNVGGMIYECENIETLFLCSFREITDMGRFMPLIGAKNVKYIYVDAMETSRVTNMSYMFADCTGLKRVYFSSMDYSEEPAGAVYSWDTSNVTNMSAMFSGCKSLEGVNLQTFRVPKVTNMSAMFFNCESLTELNLSDLDENIATDIGGLISGCKNLETLTLCSFRQLTSLSALMPTIGGDLTVKHLNLRYMDTSNVTNMNSMFYCCNKLEDIEFGNNFNTSNVKLMNDMFDGCSQITTLDLRSFNTKKTTEMQVMFKNCSNLTLIKVGPNWDYTGNGSDTRGSGMFSGCGVQSVTFE